MTRRCWSFREEIQRKYGRVVLLHGMVGVRLVAALMGAHSLNMLTPVLEQMAPRL